MSEIKRIRLPKHEIEIKKTPISKKKIRNNKIANIVRIITDVERKYFNKSRPFSAYRIETASPGNKYYDAFIGISNYLEEIREVYKSNLPMDVIIKDYLQSIYQYYKRYDRVPYVNQLSISISNKIRFDEWILDWEKQCGEKYWKIRKIISYDSIKEEADNIAKRQKDIKVKDADYIDVDFLDI